MKKEHMILFLHQNNGKLANRKRKSYKELSNHKIYRMEEAYNQVFEKIKRKHNMPFGYLVF